MSDDTTDDTIDDTMDDDTEEVFDEPVGPTAEITVTGPGVNITRSVDEGIMAEIIALLFGGAAASRGSSGSTAGGAGQGTRPRGALQQQPLPWDEDLTLGEFLEEVGAKTFQHKICAAGYYLIRFQGAPSFSRDDVRTALANAHEDMPGNLSRDFSETASKNMIATKQGEPGQYIVPTTGRKAVESNFQEVPKRRPVRRTAKKANASKSGAPA
jgi:hypothetical protein